VEGRCVWVRRVRRATWYSSLSDSCVDSCSAIITPIRAAVTNPPSGCVRTRQPTSARPRKWAAGGSHRDGRGRRGGEQEIFLQRRLAAAQPAVSGP
jgi:hypothetical protein